MTKAPAVNAARFAGGAGMGFQMRRGGAQGMNGAGFVTGEVLTKDETSLTLKLCDGGSRAVFFSTSTRVGKMTDGSLSDVAAGTNVVVNGSAAQNGALTADMIQIRPANLPSGR